MSLPKINVPSFEEIVPSTNQPIKIRQMLTKEEKILLIAKESKNLNEMNSAIKQVVNNCILDSTNINNLAVFDMEYLFLKIRALSVSNIIKRIYVDNVDKKERQFDIDLNKVEVKFPQQIVNKISINDNSYIKLSYPKCSLLDMKEITETKDLSGFIDKILFQCINEICIDNKTYDKNQLTENDVIEWIDDCPITVFEEINRFFSNLPYLYYKIEYTNDLGNQQKIELDSLEDFFTWR